MENLFLLEWTGKQTNNHDAEMMDDTYDDGTNQGVPPNGYEMVTLSGDAAMAVVVGFANADDDSDDEDMDLREEKEPLLLLFVTNNLEMMDMTRMAMNAQDMIDGPCSAEAAWKAANTSCLRSLLADDDDNVSS